MLVAIVGYRAWARKLYHHLLVNEPSLSYSNVVNYYFATSTDEVTDNTDAVLLVGWSEIVPECFYTGQPTFVLHPSKLPEYRGGSPIQHQIIDGLTESAVTIFKLDTDHKEVDSGPIATQVPYSLDGTLTEVLQNIAMAGARAVRSMFRDLADGTLTLTEQDHGLAVRVRRRKPEESEITPKELATADAVYLYNKIRALQDPYPVAFIRTIDGKRLCLTGAELCED